MMRPSLSVLVVAGAIGCATLLEGGTADAGRVRFGGGARFSGRVHHHHHGGRVSVRFARPYWRSYWRPRVWVGGSVWVGSYYPRPYYYYYYPEQVPSYYGGSYYPVQPAPMAPAAPGVVAAAAPRRSLATFGIGVSGGTTSVEDQEESTDLSALLRLRISPGLILEGELGKTEFENDLRVDRRLGGSLLWEIGAHNTFAPYLLGGLGVQQAEFDGDFTTTQQFAEVGVGLRLALSRNLHLTVDIRGGSRQTVDSDVEPARVSAEARTIAPPFRDDDDTEEYTRARLAAFLYF